MEIHRPFLLILLTHIEHLSLTFLVCKMDITEGNEYYAATKNALQKYGTGGTEFVTWYAGKSRLKAAACLLTPWRAQSMETQGRSCASELPGFQPQCPRYQILHLSFFSYKAGVTWVLVEVSRKLMP